MKEYVSVPIRCADARLSKIACYTWLVPLLLSLGVASAGAQFVGAGADVYAKLKALEAVFPRIASETLTVGTFDARTHSFRGLTSSVATGPDCGTDARGKPHCAKAGAEPVAPLAVSRARQVSLLFKITNNSGDWSVTVNGARTTASAGQTSLVAPVAAASTDTLGTIALSWRISSNSAAHADSLLIDRESLGAGAFVLPAVPVTIIYDPPQDSLHENAQKYEAARTVGNTLSFSFTNEHSSTTSTPTRFDDVNGLKKFLVAAATAIGAYYKLPELGSATQKVTDALMGNASATSTAGVDSVNTTTHQLTLTASQSSVGITHHGPGKGDLIVFLRNMRVGWASQCCAPVLLTPLGYDRFEQITVEHLQADVLEVRSGKQKLGSNSGLDTLTIQALLALDPFVRGGPSMQLPPDRFIQAASYTIDGSFEPTWSSTELQSTGGGITEFTERVETDSAGLLGTIGIDMGPSKSGTFKAKLTSSALREDLVKDATTVSLDFHVDSTHSISVDGYYDKVFGTFAFQLSPATDSVTGSIASASAGAASVARQWVTLTIGNHTYRTLSNARGEYVFRVDRRTSPVRGTLVVGSGPSAARQTLVIQTGMTRVPVVPQR